MMVMTEWLLDLDKKIFLILNSYHTPWLDQAMYYMTNTYFWLPLHALLLYITLKIYGKDSWIIILAVIAAIALANTLTSEVMKPIFLRLRPSQDPQLKDLVHTVNGYRGGLYGFASSHAANTFALAMFFWLLLKNQYKHVWLIFTWATFVTYTRLYLGVHFPGDLLVGTAIGVACGWVCFFVVKVKSRKPKAESLKQKA